MTMNLKVPHEITRAAHAISDQEVDGQPHIKALIDSLRKVRTAHSAAVQAVTDADRQIVEFRAMAQPREQQIRDLEQVLDEAALGCVLEKEEEQKKWADAEKGIEEARRFLAQHRLATPHWDRWAKGSLSSVPHLASQSSELGMQLAEARWDAKLEVARERLSR